MKSKFTYFIICLSLLSLSGCVEEYTPKDIEEIKDLLIVDGTITNGESVFKITRSVGLQTPLYEAELIYDAEVYVESDNGDIFPGYGGDYWMRWDGTYTVQMGELDPDRKYRLHIAVDNEIYKSSYLSPLFSPPIDSIFSEKPADEKPISIYVSTHDSQDQTKFYKWSYEEHWEVRSELFANAGYINDVLTMFSLNSTNNTYHCWGKDYSKKLLLGATDKISENIISRQKINEMSPSDEKLSVLYYISVKQTLLRNEAYTYFHNLQKNVELTGSIFSAIPSEMKGNIECITSPDTYIVGYVEVSTTTEKDLYINRSKNYYEPTFDTFCFNEDNRTNETDRVTGRPPAGFSFYQYESRLSVRSRCVDCRTKDNASKDKPDFWPTSSL